MNLNVLVPEVGAPESTHEDRARTVTASGPGNVCGEEEALPPLRSAGSWSQVYPSTHLTLSQAQERNISGVCWASEHHIHYYHSPQCWPKPKSCRTGWCRTLYLTFPGLKALTLGNIPRATQHLGRLVINLLNLQILLTTPATRPPIC